MQLAEDFGLKVERRQIPEEELDTFEEAGACGTAAVISPISYIDDIETGKRYDFGAEPGPVSRRLFEHLRNIHICRDHAALAVGHKDDHGGGINGELCLTAHLGEDDIVALRLNTARVDHKRGLAAPFGLAVDAVAGNTGGVVHDRQPLSD